VNYVRWLDAGQAEIEALVTMRQSLMIDATQVQNGRVKVMDRYRLLCDMVSKVIARSINQSLLDSAPCQPCCESARMMIATIT
jgi:hypothetical protein